MGVRLFKYAIEQGLSVYVSSLFKYGIEWGLSVCVGVKTFHITGWNPTNMMILSVVDLVSNTMNQTSM